jgi:hypothetical protein
VLDFVGCKVDTDVSDGRVATVLYTEDRPQVSPKSTKKHGATPTRTVIFILTA